MQQKIQQNEKSGKWVLAPMAVSSMFLQGIGRKKNPIISNIRQPNPLNLTSTTSATRLLSQCIMQRKIRIILYSCTQHMWLNVVYTAPMVADTNPKKS